MKPQIQPSKLQPTYAETAMVRKAKEINSAVNNPEYGEVAHSTRSAKVWSGVDVCYMYMQVFLSVPFIFMYIQYNNGKGEKG